MVVSAPNEAEAGAVTGERSLSLAAQALQRRSSGWVVVKLGPRGCLARGPDGVELRTTAPAVPASDTTGAGDAFNAGLLYALAAEWGWERALEFATRLASTVVSRASGHRYPTLDEVSERNADR